MHSTKSPFNEIVDFFTSLPDNESVIAFKPSHESQKYVESLLKKQLTLGLDEEENKVLDQFLLIEHLLRMSKIRAKDRIAA